MLAVPSAFPDLGCSCPLRPKQHSHTQLRAGAFHLLHPIMKSCADEMDPQFFRRYKSWLASRAYNERNREARNQKKRQRMAALRASQNQDLPTVQAARLAAKEESARKYCENNRELLAIKASAARKRAKVHREMSKEDAMLLAMRERDRLAYAVRHIEPTEYQE
ncbi:hypothetical protein K438DRAFT_2030523 [Mycena galopus ATCC 62051]|nr:hypothetical protein K438DRAFT_2030523 [Mycena galopus ATCC 62051]